jgi:hypothetical protein
MAIDPNEYYRTVADADAYFDEQLYATDWTAASADDKAKAMLAATRAVDSLQFQGLKKAVYDLLAANPDATDDEIQAAYDSQLLQFPRDTQTADTVPDDVFWGVCEEAMSLLSSKDPAQEFENLTLTSENVGGTKVSSDRSQMPPQHIANFITSALAWKYLQRWLDPNNTFDHKRVS